MQFDEQATTDLRHASERSAPPTARSSARATRPLAFDRHEHRGAFGDPGMDRSLIVNRVIAVGHAAASVRVRFGALQIVTGGGCRIPMPMEPLKAVAVGVTPRTTGTPA